MYVCISCMDGCMYAMYGCSACMYVMYVCNVCMSVCDVSMYEMYVCNACMYCNVMYGWMYVRNVWV